MGGQQQILSIGRALATRPKLLLLDEPTEGVQPSIVDEIEQILVRLNRERGIAVLLNWRLTVTELEYILNDSAPDLLIHDTEFTATAQELHALHASLGLAGPGPVSASVHAEPQQALAAAVAGMPVSLVSLVVAVRASLLTLASLVW